MLFLILASTIIRLQMTFAATIRKCKHDLQLLYKRSWAIFWHKYSTNDDPHHDFCSVEWCGYLKAARDRTSYDHQKHSLPRPVLEAIKLVFEKLCSKQSLKRVINASTQNANEAFHSIVWLMSPKTKGIFWNNVRNCLPSCNNYFQRRSFRFR